MRRNQRKRLKDKIKTVDELMVEKETYKTRLRRYGVRGTHL